MKKEANCAILGLNIGTSKNKISFANWNTIYYGVGRHWYHIQHGGNDDSSYFFYIFSKEWSSRLLKYVLQGIKNRVFFICLAWREDCGTSLHLDKDILPKCKKGDMHQRVYKHDSLKLCLSLHIVLKGG